jgi:hypothetical protein
MQCGRGGRCSSQHDENCRLFYKKEKIMFNKPTSETAADRLTILMAQLQTAESALTQARIVRGSLEALRDGISIIDPIELERADSALLAARNNVRELQREVAQAEHAVKLEREAPMRATSAKEIERRRARYAAALKKATAAMQELSAAYLDTPAGVFEELTGPSGQILAGPYSIDKLCDALTGGAPQDLVEAYGRRAQRLLDGSTPSPDLGPTLLERAIANGTRKAA